MIVGEKGSLRQNRVPECARQSQEVAISARVRSWATGTGPPRTVGGAHSRHRSGIEPQDLLSLAVIVWSQFLQTAGFPAHEQQRWPPQRDACWERGTPPRSFPSM